MSGPYYVALYGGFLAVEHYPSPGSGPEQRTITKAYTVADARQATPWPNFAEADVAAKWASNLLYPPDLRYFAILQPAFG